MKGTCSWSIFITWIVVSSCGSKDNSIFSARNSDRDQEIQNYHSADASSADELSKLAFDDFRHFYGIAWRGNAKDNLRYAREMGYTYVFYQEGMEREELANGMKFYLESPELNLVPFPQELDINQTYSQDIIAHFESRTCWKSHDSYPKNLATGWPRNKTTFTVAFDFQQQKVIDYVVSIALAKAKAIEDASGGKFRFAGFAWDEAVARGEFWSHSHSRSDPSVTLDALSKKLAKMAIDALVKGDQELAKALDPGAVFATLKEAIATNNLGKLEELQNHPILGPIINLAIPIFSPDASFRVPVSYWTGTESCLTHDGITHEYATFPEGIRSYYKTMMQEARKINPEAKWIIEPYHFYMDWLKHVETLPDAKDLIPDYFSQESRGSEFLDDKRVYESGLLSKAFVGSSQPEEQGEDKNRQLAAKIATSGSWYNWYGRFGGSMEGDMPNFQNITEVPDRLKLVRMVPNWENFAKVPLDQRTFDGTSYSSPNAAITPDTIYSRRSKTNLIYVVFNSNKGFIPLYPGESVAKVQSVDAFFSPAEDAINHVSISKEKITPSDEGVIGKGLIITLD